MEEEGLIGRGVHIRTTGRELDGGDGREGTVTDVVNGTTIVKVLVAGKLAAVERAHID